MVQFRPPSRKAYIKDQKEKRNCRLFGVFPAQYPREILCAMNALPVEIWDPPLAIDRANAHLQPYICSVVKLGLELILQGHDAMLDGFLFPHTCDSIQNLASIVKDYIGRQTPCYFFYHPKAPSGQNSRDYYREQLQTLVADLEEQLGPLDRDELRRRVRQGREIAELLREIYRLRAAGGLQASNTRFYQVIRQGEFLHPDDYVELLKSFQREYQSAAAGAPAVVLSGILPNPPEILALLDKLGVRVGDDDLLNCSRRLPETPSSADDPLDALTETYFSMPPCSTRDSSIQDRLDGLLAKIEASGAGGVIFCAVKFCEPELFDVPQLSAALKERGLATLVLDVELNQGLSGQLATRIEAFVEMFAGRT